MNSFEIALFLAILLEKCLSEFLSNGKLQKQHSPFLLNWMKMVFTSLNVRFFQAVIAKEKRWMKHCIIFMR